MKTKLNDLIAFIAVAEEESFTRAAAIKKSRDPQRESAENPLLLS